MNQKTLTLLFLLTVSFSGKAQVIFQVHGGVSYIEHFSAGIGCTFSKKHSVSLLYGSNFFIRPKDFSSYLLQYNLILHKIKIAGVTPTIGVKGGKTIFTDEYYTWNVDAIIPFIGAQYTINKKVDLLAQAGITFSFEQSVERIKYGEIGHYRDKLPEMKVGVVYHLTKAQ